MNKYTKWIAFALLGLGIMVAILAFFLGNARTVNPPAPTPRIKESAKFSVVMASKNLQAGHIVTAEDLEVQVLSQMPASGMSSAAQAVGRSTAVEIAKGAPLVQSQLLDGVVAMLAPGERAVSIKVDESSAVGHKVKPGDWVDVFWVIKRDGQEVEFTQSRMLLPKKKILAYGAQLDVSVQAPSEEDNQKKSSNERPQTARTAVIGVKVEEVNRLLLAEQHGQVLLALRSPLDLAEPSEEKRGLFAGLSATGSTANALADGTENIDVSLMALALSDLSRDQRKKTVIAPSRADSRKRTANTSQGMRVEVLRGTRSEMVSY